MKQSSFIAFWLLVVQILGNLFVYGPAMAEGFVVIVNRDNAVERMSSRSIRKIFLYRQTHWPDGAEINIVLNDTGPSYSDFSRSLLRKTPSQYLIFRKKILFNGSAIPPRRVKSDEEVIQFVERYNNGIGFIDSASLDNRVKQLIIADGYPTP